MIIKEIKYALEQLRIPISDFFLLENSKAELLYYELLNEFVEGGDRRWWWESFKNPSKSIHFLDGLAFKRIPDLVPDITKKVWFVVEEIQLPFFPIYDATIEAIVRIIGECYGFEYYIIPKSREWLLCENHHDRLIGVGNTILNNIDKFDD